MTPRPEPRTVLEHLLTKELKEAQDHLAQPALLLAPQVEGGNVYKAVDALMVRRHDLMRDLAAEKAKAIYEFSEGDFPVFSEGREPHELEERVTAARCNQLVQLIVTERARVATLQDRLDLLEAAVRESSGVIKLLYRSQPTNIVVTCNEVLDRNNAALEKGKE